MYTELTIGRYESVNGTHCRYMYKKFGTSVRQFVNELLIGTFVVVYCYSTYYKAGVYYYSTYCNAVRVGGGGKWRT